MQVKVDLLRLKVAEECDQILEAATQPIHGPRGHHIELPTGDRAQ